MIYALYTIVGPRKFSYKACTRYSKHNIYTFNVVVNLMTTNSLVKFMV